MLFFGITLFAQEETVSYIMNDGSVKTYNLSDIEEISMQEGQTAYEMKIHLKDSAPVSYLSNQFDSVQYSRDSYNNYVYVVFSGANQYSYLLANIDSISYYYDIVSEYTVKIGNQIWMTKNLDVDRYRNGDPIPQVTDPTEWINLKTGAWCYYNNDPAMGAIYGKLYNWYAVNDPRGLAPEGWTIPSDYVWTTLVASLGGAEVAGAKLKEAGTNHWNSNTGATNESGFTALPGGNRFNDGKDISLGLYGAWWSSTLYGENKAGGLGIMYNSNSAETNAKGNLYCGLSVRCLKESKEVKIGTQIWMTKNLDVDRYRNGDPIRHAQTDAEWQDAYSKQEGAWCYCDNDPANGEIYGKLYNGYAVNDPRGLAPEGWHIALDVEWTELENYLIANGYNYDGTTTGNKIGKALASASGWIPDSDTGVIGNTDYPAKRNATGLSALPGGFRYEHGTYHYDSIGRLCYWWAATENPDTFAWVRFLNYSYTGFYRNMHSLGVGSSVRCVKD